MKFKCNLVSSVADTEVLQFTSTVLLQRLSDLMHFDEVGRNNLLGLFNSCVFYVRIERNVNDSKSGKGDGRNIGTVGLYFSSICEFDLFHK